MMGILAISEYIRHGKRNVFIVFQMAALLFVLCVSAFGGIPPVSTICAIESQGGALFICIGIPWCKSGCYCKGHGKG